MLYFHILMRQFIGFKRITQLEILINQIAFTTNINEASEVQGRAEQISRAVI